MTYTDHELLNCCLHVCVDPDMTLVAWKRNPHCFLLRVGGGVHVNQDIHHATDQPQACPHINIILCVSVAVHRSDQLSSCPLSIFLLNFDLPIPTVG